MKKGLMEGRSSFGRSPDHVFIVDASESGYTVQVIPTGSETGRAPSFYSDQTLRIREDYGPDPAQG